MAAQPSIPEIVASAREGAIAAEQRLLAGAEAQADDTFDTAVLAIEKAAIEIHSVFEARMQHHYRRGPFSRKLKNQLLEAGETDLAQRVHLYYLAVNVLKHGKGASHRELLATPTELFAVKEVSETTGLVDVTGAGFFHGLTSTILEAYEFLEKH